MVSSAAWAGVVVSAGFSKLKAFGVEVASQGCSGCVVNSPARVLLQELLLEQMCAGAQRA